MFPKSEAAHKEEDWECAQNIVLVGDEAVGKTSLLFAYQNESLVTSYNPTSIFAKNEIKLTLDGRTYPINFHDTAGHEELEKVRQVFYKTADAIVLCYSLADRSSFENIEYKWCPELQLPIRRHVPIILVGTKSDLRNPEDSATAAVVTVEGIQLCNRINAAAFLECSASTQTNIAEVIYESVRAAVRFSARAEQDGYYDDNDDDDDEVGDNSTSSDGVEAGGSGQNNKKNRRNLRSKRNSFRIFFRKCF